VNFILLSLSSTISLVCLVLCLLMRLNQNQIDTLKRIGSEVFGTQAKLMLFGSRLNDAVRGGDIDFFIPGDWPPEEAVPRRLRFCAELRRCLGDQKIDLVVENKITSPIQNNAKQQGEPIPL